MTKNQIFDHLNFDIIDSLPGHVFLKDEESRYLSVNQSFANTSGKYKPTELIGKSDFDMPWLEQESRKFVQDDKQVMYKNKPLLELKETIFERPILTHKFPLVGVGGKVIGVLGMFFHLDDKQDPQLAHLLSLRNFNAITDTKKHYVAIDNELVCLTRREMDCAHLVLLGYSAKEMASKLGISVYTVQIHIKNLKAKLKANSRSRLVEKILSSDLVKVIINR